MADMNKYINHDDKVHSFYVEVATDTKPCCLQSTTVLPPEAPPGFTKQARKEAAGNAQISMEESAQEPRRKAEKKRSRGGEQVLEDKEKGIHVEAEKQLRWGR